VPPIVTGEVLAGGEAARAVTGSADPAAIVASANGAMQNKRCLIFRVRLICDGYLIQPRFERFSGTALLNHAQFARFLYSDPRLGSARSTVEIFIAQSRMGNAWATQHPATAVNLSLSQTAKLAL
jgi:hypothetical protein